MQKNMQKLQFLFHLSSLKKTQIIKISKLINNFLLIMLKNKKPFNLIFSKKNLVHKKEKNLFIGRWINQPNLKKIKIKNNKY